MCMPSARPPTIVGGLPHPAPAFARRARDCGARTSFVGPIIVKKISRSANALLRSPEHRSTQRYRTSLFFCLHTSSPEDDYTAVRVR